MSNKKNYFLFLLPVILFCIAGGLFYGLFFQLAPYVVSVVPPGEWHNFVGALVYIVIAYFGGIGVPLVFSIWGIKALILAVCSVKH